MAKVVEPTASKRPLVSRLALGGVALAAASLATLGLFGHHADTFHHDAARLLQEITSAKGIEVTLRDSNGIQVHGMLLPKASATAPSQLEFDGRLSYELAGAQYNFTLLNDRAYVTVEDLTTGTLARNECLDPDHVPPVATLTDALKHARVIDAVSGFNVTCASGKMVEFDFAGEPFVLCANGATANDGAGTVSVRGDDLDASLKLLRDNAQGVPSLASLSPPAGLDLTKCEAITPTSGDDSLVKPAAASSAASRLLQRTQDALTVATGGRRLGKLATAECGCTNGKKQCLFVHGFGYPDTGAATDSFEYFGTIEQQLPCCESVKFVHLDTNDEAWYSDKLTSKVCDTAVAMTGSKDPMQLENLQLVAHSMGNLIFSAALMNKKCALAKSSKWVSLAGPIFGTKTATNIVSVLDAIPSTTLQAWCANDPNTVLDDPIFSLLESNSLCSTLTSMRSIVAEGSAKSTPALDALFEQAAATFRANVGANVCGTSPSGLLSSDSAKKVLESLISGHPTPENDGQVHIDSCQGGLAKSKYASSWSGGAFYKASVNHLDLAMRHGDGWWGNDRKPVKWLQCQF